MDVQDIRTLEILEKIEAEPSASQRELARSLGVSLGLVNAFVKRLARKGYFKVTTIPRNRVKYMLTPTGAAEKARLTCEYLKYSFALYRNSREATAALFREQAKKGHRRIVFFGAGEMAEIAYVSLTEAGLELVAVVDRKTPGKAFLGFTVEKPTVLERLVFDKVVVTDLEKTDQCLAELASLKVPGDRIEILRVR